MGIFLLWGAKGPPTYKYRTPCHHLAVISANQPGIRCHFVHNTHKKLDLRVRCKHLVIYGWWTQIWLARPWTVCRYIHRNSYAYTYYQYFVSACTIYRTPRIPRHFELWPPIESKYLPDMCNISKCFLMKSNLAPVRMWYVHARQCELLDRQILGIDNSQTRVEVVDADGEQDLLFQFLHHMKTYYFLEHL